MMLKIPKKRKAKNPNQFSFRCATEQEAQALRARLAYHDCSLVDFVMFHVNATKPKGVKK